MGTVGNLVDRCFRELLLPADDQPVRTTLNGAVTDSATTWIYDGSDLSADEEELFAPGVVVEAGLEQAVVTAADHSTNTLTVRRGQNGTEATAHDDGAVITPAPTFSRRAVFEAVCDNVVSLYPSLFKVVTETITVGSVYTEVPAELITAVGMTVARGGRYYEASVSTLTSFPPSTTGKAITVTGANAGSTGYLTFRGKFARPTSEDDDLQDLGVDESWERIVMAGAGAQLAAGREFDSTNVEFITEALRSEGLPEGSLARKRDGLIRLHSYWMDLARRQVLAQHAEVVSMNAVG